MLKNNWQYSTIRQEPIHYPNDGYNLSDFYNRITNPTGIVFTILGFIAIGKDSIWNNLSQAFTGKYESNLYLLLFTLSLLAGLRLLQSIYLAKRDYSHFRSRFGDIFIFLCVMGFLAGAGINAFADNQLLALLFYTVTAFVGTFNFIHIYGNKISPHSNKDDYPVERRIQGVNILVWACVTILLIAATYLHVYKSNVTAIYAIIIATYPLIILNSFHSGQLTLSPKFLIQNKPDIPETKILSIKAILGNMSSTRTDEIISSAIQNDVNIQVKSLRTIRATRGDVEIICEELLKNFGYIYTFIFNAKNEDVLKLTMRKLITFAGGFGAIGFTNFYFIIDKNTGEKVGLFKISSSDKKWLYRMLEVFILPFKIAISLKTIDVIGLIQRTKRVMAFQPGLSRDELRLDYLIIFSKFQGERYGKTFIHLLNNAFLRNYTNDITAERISLFVRETNQNARYIFERAGFAPQSIGLGTEDYDPFAESEGKAIFLVHTREDAEPA